jgi:hypothetical protein
MGSLNNPNRWRLLSPGGTVPVKYLSLDGSFEAQTGSVVLKFLIPTNRLVDFLKESFPPPLVVNDITIPTSVPLPGLPGLRIRKVSFKSQDPGKPVDPFGWDGAAPIGTYHEAMEVDVEFGPLNTQQPKSSDPFTFLEISAHDTGEFIHSTAPKAKWAKEKANPKNLPDSQDPGKVASTSDKTKTSDPSSQPAQPNGTDSQKDPTIPMMILVPHTEWTVTWNQVPFYYFFNILVRRLRWCLGRVNSDIMPLLFNAYPETVLFTGYSYKNVYTWKDYEIGIPPINVEMKFLEKRVVWNDGLIKGHNHFWRPGVGWERLLIDGKNSVYSQRDMNVIWDLS